LVHGRSKDASTQLPLHLDLSPHEGSVLLAILLHASLNLAAGPLPTVLGSSTNALRSLHYTGLIVGLTIIAVIVADLAHPSPQPSEHPQEESAGVNDSRSSCFFFSLWQLSFPLNRQTQAKVSCEASSIDWFLNMLELSRKVRESLYSCHESP
jgi:hypothetical protein